MEIINIFTHLSAPQLPQMMNSFDGRRTRFILLVSEAGERRVTATGWSSILPIAPPCRYDYARGNHRREEPTWNIIKWFLQNRSLFPDYHCIPRTESKVRLYISSLAHRFPDYHKIQKRKVRLNTSSIAHPFPDYQSTQGRKVQLNRLRAPIYFILESKRLVKDISHPSQITLHLCFLAMSRPSGSGRISIPR